MFTSSRADGAPHPLLGRRARDRTLIPFILHLFAALAEKERSMIATRTKAALAAAKARGVKLVVQSSLKRGKPRRFHQGSCGPPRS